MGTSWARSRSNHTNLAKPVRVVGFYQSWEPTDLHISTQDEEICRYHDNFRNFFLDRHVFGPHGGPFYDAVLQMAALVRWDRISSSHDVGDVLIYQERKTLTVANVVCDRRSLEANAMYPN